MTLAEMADAFVALYFKDMSHDGAARTRNALLLMLETAEAKGASRGAREAYESVFKRSDLQ